MRKLWLELRWQMIIGTVLCGLSAWIVFMIADNQPPYEYATAGSYVIPSVAGNGDQITVKWKLSRINRICPGWNRRVLFDPKSGVILANYDPIPTAMIDSVLDGYLNRTFLLPRDLPSGDIGYRANVCYECNLFQRFVRPLCLSTPELIFRIR